MANRTNKMPCVSLAEQEDVFSKIGKGAVTNVLAGYNSTVFAYGQTGSGKTFTVTGGAERCDVATHALSSQLRWEGHI